MSSFSWLDGSEKQRSQMLDVINLFREKETRDELGIGTIRDAFADLFFPGTSTIQTRARYFLFIPWIYTNLERTRVPSDKIGRRARQDEIRLINTLYNNGATDGLIGINARSSLKRLPSAIYWQGLGSWGIRMFDGPRASYQRSLDGFYTANGQVNQFHKENWDDDEINEMQVRQLYNWHPGARDLRPIEFPSDSTFDLTNEEASYLQERIVSSKPGSLLAFFVSETKDITRTSFPWEYPDWVHMPDQLQEQLHHAHYFSLVIHGAALLYNLMLAEMAQTKNDTEGDDRIDIYQEALTHWVDTLHQEEHALTNWDWHNRFWEIVRQGNPHIPPRTEKFVNDWLRLVLQGDPATIANNQNARQIILRRERRLKGKLSRLHNPRSLELWSGAAGTGRLNYRWGVTQTILTDILEGLSCA